MKVLKPNIEGWEADFGKETITKGKAYLNMTWSDDAVWAIEEAGLCLRCSLDSVPSCSRSNYTFRNFWMAMAEPPAPMAKPAPRNTSRTRWDMLAKGTVEMMDKMPLLAMAFTMRP